MSAIAEMLKPRLLCLLLLFFFFFMSAELLHSSYGDVGTAAYYGAPYLPTACYGTDFSQFPANNLFAAASEGIWDNGASCGRQYLVRCLSPATSGNCILGQTILVTVVDRALSMASSPTTLGTTMVLSSGAFSLIADRSSTDAINIEFQQV